MFQKYDNPQRNRKFKTELIKIRGHRCECCLNEKWLDQPITLELHHFDGDHSNFMSDNL